MFIIWIVWDWLGLLVCGYLLCSFVLGLPVVCGDFTDLIYCFIDLCA